MMTAEMFPYITTIVVVVVAAMTVVSTARVPIISSGACQPIRIEQCRDLPYNDTRFPNLVGDDSPKDAEAALITFEPLIAMVRAEKNQLRFFLCSVYFPMCTDKVHFSIGPCRPLCERVRARCEPLLKEFGFAWPASMNCSKFPAENNNDAMCMKGPMMGGGDDDDELDKIVLPPPPSYFIHHDHHNHRCIVGAVYINRTGACVPVCDDEHSDQRRLAARFLMILAGVCVVLSVACVVCVGCCSTHHHTAPPPSQSNDAPELLAERALLFCALSFGVSALVFLVALCNRTGLGCVSYNSIAIQIVPAGMQYAPCTVVGMLLYYFGTTGRIWWSILCASRIIPAGLPMRRIQTLAWTLPLALVIAVLITQSIHTEPMTGVCQVGARHSHLLLAFVATREAIAIAVCSVALAACGCRPPTNRLALIGCMYPAIGTALFALQLRQYWHDGVVGTDWAVARFGVELGLGLVACASCCGCLLVHALRATRSSVGEKVSMPVAVSNRYCETPTTLGHHHHRHHHSPLLFPAPNTVQHHLL